MSATEWSFAIEQSYWNRLFFFCNEIKELKNPTLETIKGIADRHLTEFSQEVIQILGSNKFSSSDINRMVNGERKLLLTNMINQVKEMNVLTN